MSQLDLASAAESTPRYVSFVETGRSRPSRRMVVRLARALDVPLRERNGLLVAAGYAPMYGLEPLGSPQLNWVDTALSTMLAQHEPFPAVVMDRRWDVLRTNAGAQRLFGRLHGTVPLPEQPNVLRMMIEPGPVREHVLNWPAVVPALLDRARREAVGGVLDRATTALVDRLRALPEVAGLLAAADSSTPQGPVIDVSFDVDGVAVHFFSVVSTIGTPADVTAQELRVEAFFPSVDETRERWPALAAAGLPVESP
jgi:transcriptional regulator with XRE-family HTH domain